MDYKYWKSVPKEYISKWDANKSLRDDFTIENAMAIQQQLRTQIVSDKKIEHVETIAGVDLAYWKDKEQEQAVCCIVVIEEKTKKIIDYQYTSGTITVPYIPGCLAFRELPLVLETAEKLKETPDLYMFDGNGYLHPRNMGIASHASFYLHVPTIGVAKHYYKIGDTEYTEPENEANSYTDIVVDGKVYGRALRTHKNVRPVFVSIGNYIDLDSATKIVCDFVNKESHIPVPTRLADIETRKMREKLMSADCFL